MWIAPPILSQDYGVRVQSLPGHKIRDYRERFQGACRIIEIRRCETTGQLQAQPNRISGLRLYTKDIHIAEIAETSSYSYSAQHEVANALYTQ